MFNIMGDTLFLHPGREEYVVKRKRGLYLMVMGLFFIICIASDVHGAGFGIFTQGASELGQADATVAHGDTPSVIFFNPALINGLSGTQIENGATLLFPSRKFSSFGDGSSQTKSKVYYPATIYLTHKVSDTVSTGIGIFSPFGLGTDWPADWEGRYIATKSEMKTFTFNPVVSFKVTRNITLAAGLDYLLLSAKLEKKIDMTVFDPVLPDASQTFKTRGTNDGWGYNLGALFDLGKGFSAGISYRSSIFVDIKGSVHHELPSGAPAALFPDTTGKTNIRLPQQFNAGIAYTGLAPLTVEAGMRWEGWHSFRELRIDLDQPIAGNSSSVSPRNWKDTYSFMVGGKYDLTPNIAMLAGYLYSGNPVPDSTFEPSIPDAKVQLFSIGTDLRFKKMKFSIAYGYQKYQKNAKNNSIGGGDANGTYRSDINILGVSVAYAF
jgi:long-chain fatty acid transport protein